MVEDVVEVFDQPGRSGNWPLSHLQGTGNSESIRGEVGLWGGWSGCFYLLIMKVQSVHRTTGKGDE